MNISLLAITSPAKVLRVKPTDFIKTAPTHTPQRIKSRRCIVRIARRLQVGAWDAGREFVVLQWIASQGRVLRFAHPMPPDHRTVPRSDPARYSKQIIG